MGIQSSQKLGLVRAGQVDTFDRLEVNRRVELNKISDKEWQFISVEYGSTKGEETESDVR